jgi:hypothetical protein
VDDLADDERVAVGAEFDYLVELALQMNLHLGDRPESHWRNRPSPSTPVR